MFGIDTQQMRIVTVVGTKILKDTVLLKSDSKNLKVKLAFIPIGGMLATV